MLLSFDNIQSLMHDVRLTSDVQRQRTSQSATDIRHEVLLVTLRKLHLMIHLNPAGPIPPGAACGTG